MMRVPTNAGRVSRRGLVLIVSAVLCSIGLLQIAAGVLVPAKAFAAQLLLERAFDRSVAQHRPLKPWYWADMAPVARISVPRLGADRIVLDTGSGQAMAFGPTLLPDSAPLGEPGISVISAHRDTHFRFLKDIRLGDRIDLQGIDGVRRHYQVTGHTVVAWDRFAVPLQGGGSELALSTCYPFDKIGHGPLRYVVRAVAVNDRQL